MNVKAAWGVEQEYYLVQEGELEDQLNGLQPENLRHLLDRQGVANKKALAAAVIDELQAQL
jgi:glutamine synthetase